MKKANSGDRGSAAKGNVAPKDVDEYLAGVPEPARSTLHRVRATIRSAVPPEATEAISYRIPAFRYKGPLLGFAAFSNQCSLFPMSPSVMEAFKNELKDFHTSKGTIHFPVGQPLLAALVKKLGEGADRGERTQETALIRLPSRPQVVSPRLEGQS